MWLEKLFGDSAVPQYEVNDWTLGVLYQLMSKNERLNSHSVCVREDLYQKAKEYKTEGVLLFNVVMLMLAFMQGHMFCFSQKILCRQRVHV